MRILESFIDCVYESDLYEYDMKEIRQKLLSKLPDKRIYSLANILIIATKYDLYAVKIRMCETKEDGSIDVKRIHKEIRKADFIEISKDDYFSQVGNESKRDAKDWGSITKRTNELITPGANVIFKMNIDVDTLC